MIIDISQGLSPGMAVFPGDAAYEESWTFRIGPDCPVNVSRVAFSVHCGTHADAPLHYDAEGATAGALSLEPYIGPCRVIDARGDGPLCVPEDIEAAAGRRTAAHPAAAGGRARSENLAHRVPGACCPKQWTLLASRGVMLVGIDTPSVDPETSKTARRRITPAAGPTCGSSRTSCWPMWSRGTTN